MNDDTHPHTHLHCWHAIPDGEYGIPRKEFRPKSYERICCHCGQTQMYTPPEAWEGHGPHYPREPE